MEGNNDPGASITLDELLQQICLPTKDVPKQLRKSLTKVTPATLRPPFQILSKRLDKTIASLYATSEIAATDSFDVRENKNNLLFLSSRLDKLDGELLRLGDLNLSNTVPQMKSDLRNLEDSLRRSIDTNTRKMDKRIVDLETTLDERISTNYDKLMAKIISTEERGGDVHGSIIKIDAQSRHALEEVRVLTERFNSRGRTQLEELEKITTTQVSLYLTGIASDITRLTERLSDLESKEEERKEGYQKLQKETELTHRSLARDICGLVDDVQNNRDAVALMELNSAGMRERLIALKARKHLDSGSRMNTQISQHLDRMFILRDSKGEHAALDETSQAGRGKCTCECGTKDNTVAELQNQVEVMKKQQAVLVDAVENSISRIQNIADITVSAFKNSEKKTNAKLEDFSSILLWISDKLTGEQKKKKGV